MAGDTAVETTNLAPEPAYTSGQKISELTPVYFEFDSFTLSADAKAKLDANVSWLLANPSIAVLISGHCDERGTTEYNLALGERRAGVVKDYLVSRGVPAVQVATISYGEERPSVVGSDEYAWSQNRRAEFEAQ